MGVINDSGFVVHCGEVLTASGEKLLTLAKGTFVLRAGAATLTAIPEDEARPVRFATHTWGDPIVTPPKYPCDIAPHKAATDVIVVAKGYTPGGKPVESFDVGVVVGSLKKTLRIYGLRVWQQRGAGLSSPPRAVVEQEIRYDEAWGGSDISDLQNPLADMRNPVGNGVVRDLSQLTDKLAPCIEDPAHPLFSVETAPAPAGLGPLGPHWLPRSRFAGTYDEAWLRDQAPLPPGDLSPAHHQCASPGLIANPPLAGNESVRLTNLTPGGGNVEFALPGIGATITHELSGEPAGHYEPHLDTVIIDTLHPPEGTTVLVELVWRSLTNVPRRMANHEVLIRQQRR